MRRSMLLLASTSLLLICTMPAGAGTKAPRTVKACSSWGNGCMTAPVRAGKFGPEVRLKGGTWIDCRGDCRETLREEVLDFWETQNDKAIAGTP